MKGYSRDVRVLMVAGFFYQCCSVSTSPIVAGYAQSIGASGLWMGIISALITAAAVVWSLMLGIFDGAPLVLLTVVLYALRGKPTLRMILGCVTAFACSIFSLYYMLAPITMILLHFYNGEKGESNPWVDHLSYPVILLVLGIVGNYLI